MDFIKDEVWAWLFKIFLYFAEKQIDMKINIVIPCYNEQEVLPKTLEVLGNLVAKIKAETGAETNLLLVDDGSRDTTWQLIREGAENIRT